jgi:hypothetical protein
VTTRANPYTTNRALRLNSTLAPLPITNFRKYHATGTLLSAPPGVAVAVPVAAIPDFDDAARSIVRPSFFISFMNACYHLLSLTIIYAIFLLSSLVNKII